MNGHDNRRRTDVALPLARFAVTGLLAVIVVAAIGVSLQRQAARDDAVSDAKTLATLAGKGIVEPNVTPELLRGDRDALARMDALVRSRILSRDGISRVKLWTADGRIVYSDLRPLIGRRFPISDHDREKLRGGEVIAEETQLERDENRLDRLEGKLLEVYLPITAANGQTLLFELYQRQSTVATDAKQTWLAFAPAMIGALIVLQLLQLPLAYRMARDLQDSRQEREALLVKALEASGNERRRIAGDLHDGVVQDLAGTSYALSAAAERASRRWSPAGYARA
jgi:signal transduction histidine kinase